MNSYTLSDIKIGTKETFQITVTFEKMELFYQLTGDDSPIHRNEEYALERGFKGRVCYGMLGAAMFSTLGGVYLPGEHCLLHSVEAKFVSPIFIGDVLTVEGTVCEINDVFNEITIKGVIRNQDGKKVIRGIIKAGVAK